MCAGIVSRPARSRANSYVTCSEFEIMSWMFELSPRFGQESQKVRGYQTLLTNLLGSQVARQPVEVNGEAEAFDEGSKIFLRQHSSNQSSQNVPGSTRCHSRIPCGVDVNRSIRNGDYRTKAFQNNVSISASGKIRCNL